jgi:16S rRNA (cytidine1402-2'-O)-methyltransferase
MKKIQFKTLEISFEKNQSQIFIETPYRIISYWNSDVTSRTHLCIATDITFILNILRPKIAAWKKRLLIYTSDLLFFIIHKCGWVWDV